MEDHRGAEAIGHKPGIEVAEPNPVDFLALDPGVGQRLPGRILDQCLKIERVQLPKFGVSPADDECIHLSVPFSVVVVSQKIRRFGCKGGVAQPSIRSEEHTSELQSLMRISYAVFCLKKKT